MVTGAARGIGRACAVRLAHDGADLVLNDLEASEALRTLSNEIEGMGRRVLLAPADVSDSRALKGVFTEIKAKFGRLDVLVNNAAWSARKPFLEQSEEDMRRTLDVSLWGGIICAQHAARLMLGRGGSMVMISSVHAERPYPEAALYNAAKAGTNHFALSLANELAEKGIRVNVIEPGWIDTPGERRYNSEEQMVQRQAVLPMKRLGTAAEIASAVAWLCSDEQCYVTGTVLRVDGGFALRF